MALAKSGEWRPLDVELSRYLWAQASEGPVYPAVSLPGPIPVYSTRPGIGADSPRLTLARCMCRTDCSDGALGSPVFLLIYPDFSVRCTDRAIYLL